MDITLKTNRMRRRIKFKAKLSRIKPARLRLAVYRSSRYIYAQIIDDAKSRTIAYASDKEILQKNDRKSTKSDRAFGVGKLIAEKAKKHKITSIVFDRAGYLYHGRIKRLAEGAREGGLQF